MMFANHMLKNRTVLFAGVIIAFVLLVSGALIYIANNPNPANSPEKSYSASAEYAAPGPEAKKLDLTVVLDGDTIKDITVSDKTSDGETSKYEEAFSIAAKERVVGKSITSQFDQSYINGSSLTSVAFFEALADIKSQAE